MVSPDEDFSPTGTTSGIKYSESFKKYKEMLTATPDSPVFKRIFSKFNSSLFDTAPTISGDLIAEDGDYDSELDQFRAELLADHVGGVTTDMVSLSLHQDSPSQPTSELPAIQPERHVSISVTSHVSTRIGAASSQVSNVINSSIALSPTESEVEESSPPSPKATRPPPKKKGARSSKKATATHEESDAAKDTPPVSPEIAMAKKTALIQPPARALRKRR